MTNNGATDKKGKGATFTRSTEVPLDLNKIKIEQLKQLHNQWTKALPFYGSIIKRKILEDGKFPGKYPEPGLITTLRKQNPLGLNFNHHAAVWAQAHASFKSWFELMQDAFKKQMINSESIDESLFHDLFFINSMGAWFSRTTIFEFYSKKNDETTYHIVQDEALLLARRLARWLIANGHSFPNLKYCKTMALNGRAIDIEEKKQATHFEYWAKIPSLIEGKSLEIPIRKHHELEEFLSVEGATLSRYSLQVIFKEGCRLEAAVSLPKVTLRTDGEEMPLDWGARSIFTNDRGEVFGQRLWLWLQERDKELLELSRALQHSGIKLKKSKRYRRLQKRIRDYFTNEINRILNRLSEHEISLFIVESLDFRDPSFSKRMSRLLNRTYRAVVKEKFADLKDRKGIGTEEVNPAFTSQQCSNEACGFTHKKNRNGAHFKCLCCGVKLSADCNASRIIKSRRSRPKLRWMKRGDLFQLLGDEHEKRVHKRPKRYGVSEPCDAANRAARSRTSVAVAGDGLNDCGSNGSNNSAISV